MSIRERRSFFKWLIRSSAGAVSSGQGHVQVCEMGGGECVRERKRLAVRYPSVEGGDVERASANCAAITLWRLEQPC